MYPGEAVSTPHEQARPPLRLYGSPANQQRWRGRRAGRPGDSPSFMLVVRDELEGSAGWTTVGIARVLTEKQARTIAAATGG
jgi:hypothetical protein